MTDRDRAWDAEHHRAALQIITEADRGLRVAEHELKGGRLMDARETVRLVRGLLPPLERAIQRRPVRAEDAAEAHRDSLAASLIEAHREKLAIVEAVRKLHREVEMEVLGPDCADETCGHEECPTVAFKACAHCYEIGEAAHWDAFEAQGLEAVAWPCPTIRALDAGGVS